MHFRSKLTGFTPSRCLPTTPARLVSEFLSRRAPLPPHHSCSSLLISNLASDSSPSPSNDLPVLIKHEDTGDKPSIHNRGGRLCLNSLMYHELVEREPLVDLCGIRDGEFVSISVKKLRKRQMRNLFLCLMVSQGVPMFYMGDEYGHTKGGNNNTYCHDNYAVDIELQISIGLNN